MVGTLLSIHKVDVLKPTFTLGAAMGVQRDYSTIDRTLDCRVVPVSASERVLLFKDGYQVSHRILFLTDPHLPLETRLGWKPEDGPYTILRVVPPTRPHGFRLWDVSALSHLEDNQQVEEIA